MENSVMVNPKAGRLGPRRRASFLIVGAVAAAGVFCVAPAAHADCRSACQSEYYGCLHVNSTSTCSTARWICNNRCSSNGGGAAYGALAYSPSTGAVGYSSKYGTQGEAEGAAIRFCRQYGGTDDCKIEVWFNKACGALAANGKGAYGSAWGHSSAEAERLALARCNGRDAQACAIKRLVCSR
jgi:hypothetical protein